MLMLRILARKKKGENFRLTEERGNINKSLEVVIQGFYPLLGEVLLLFQFKKHLRHGFMVPSYPKLAHIFKLIDTKSKVFGTIENSFVAYFVVQTLIPFGKAAGFFFFFLDFSVIETESTENVKQSGNVCSSIKKHNMSFQSLIEQHRANQLSEDMAFNSQSSINLFYRLSLSHI